MGIVNIDDDLHTNKQTNINLSKPRSIYAWPNGWGEEAGDSSKCVSQLTIQNYALIKRKQT